jgi:hypothetical protein
VLVNWGGGGEGGEGAIEGFSYIPGKLSFLR